jgi:hypothetical protein
MITLDATFLGLHARQVWFPESPEAAVAELDRAPVVDVMQCSQAVAEGLKPWAFRQREFHTSLIDLALSEEQLWANLEKKTCRYQLNRAKKLTGVEVLHNQRQDLAYQVIDDFIRRTTFRERIEADEWERIVACSDIFIATHEGRPVAVHAILADAPRCARALISATADRSDGADRSLVSALNRWLHWHEILHYRARGLHWYDFGGIVIDENAPEWSIAQFKLGFGGTTVTQHVVRLARNPLLRLGLRAALSARKRPAPAPAVAKASHGLA